MPLGATAFTSVSWTVGDVITEAKLDYMADNDRAYDSHATQGILLNNDKGVVIKDSGGTNREVLNISSADVLKIGDDDTSTVLSTGVLNAIYPVGTIYTTVVATNPGTIFGGTWVEFGAGRVLVGRSSGETEFDTVEKTGGAKTVTLSEAQMPVHTHTQNAHSHSGTTGGVSSLPYPTSNGSAYVGGVAGGTDRITYQKAQDGVNTMDHTHGFTTGNATATNNNAGGGASHNNIQPYIVVYFFKRTA